MMMLVMMMMTTTTTTTTKLLLLLLKIIIIRRIMTTTTMTTTTTTTTTIMRTSMMMMTTTTTTTTTTATSSGTRIKTIQERKRAQTTMTTITSTTANTTMMASFVIFVNAWSTDMNTRWREDDNTTTSPRRDNRNLITLNIDTYHILSLLCPDLMKLLSIILPNIRPSMLANIPSKTAGTVICLISLKCLFLGWLLSAGMSGTDLFRQFYVLSH